MPKHSGVNSKAAEALQRRKEQKELIARKKEEEKLDKLWQDDDKLTKAKQERKLETQRKQQEKLQKKTELRNLLEQEEAQLVSNKQCAKGNPIPKVTRAECLRNQLLQAQKAKEAAAKREDYVSVHDDLLRANTNHQIMAEKLELEEQNIELITASGIDDVLSALSLDSKDSRFDKSIKSTYLAFQERKMAELKTEYPNLKLSQYKDMIFKLWKKSPENPFNAS
ncbi:DUF1014 domain-containing protein [Theileria equi strain WA]|uniref:DUF1014 domain-containing protein n=1 Tax=Theileria equi strain WA TaxID=1537102 RepID=L0B009_THEEQ|nr:DUF1014 domain-containing protein [Theileria equi strain WA]AFZ81155.1 DUF1014 domain-containing protein [Theileria equi strain WA]|eukprot:XP_004830821.1 DUF1014 domain-containing protein [Theileria equi strain WA]